MERSSEVIENPSSGRRLPSRETAEERRYYHPIQKDYATERKP